MEVKIFQWIIWDVIMNQTLADRQRELEQITSSFSKSQQEEATKWLNNGETPKIKILEM